MEVLLEKLTSYQIFSSAIPGAIFLLFVCWLRKIDRKDLNGAVFVLLAYFTVLAMNRLGGFAEFATGWLDECRRERLFRRYQESVLNQSVYDTFVMYRTFLVAMLLVFIMTLLPGSRKIDSLRPWVLPVAAFALAAIFTGAVFMQGRYVDQLIKTATYACRSANAVAPAPGTPPPGSARPAPPPSPRPSPGSSPAPRDPPRNP